MSTLAFGGWRPGRSGLTTRTRWTLVAVAVASLTAAGAWLAWPAKAADPCQSGATHTALTSGDWSGNAAANTLRWGTTTAPTASTDKVCIPTGITITIGNANPTITWVSGNGALTTGGNGKLSVSAASDITTLNMTSGNTGGVIGDGSITVHTVNWTQLSNVLEGTGPLVVTGSFSHPAGNKTIAKPIMIANGATASLAPGSGNTLTFTGAFTNNGTTTNSNGVLSTAALTNGGTLNLDSTGNTTFGGLFTNSGTASRTSTGNLTTAAIANSGTLNLSSTGTTTVGGAVTNTGTLNWNTGAVTLSGTNSLSNNAGGTFNVGSATPDATGGTVFTVGGTFTNAGTTNLTTGLTTGGLTINGASSSNSGTITINDGAIRLPAAHTMTNSASGLIDIKNSGASTPLLRVGAGTASLTNQGTLRRSGSAGAAVVNLNVTNAGSIQLQQSSLAFTGTFTNTNTTGGFEVAASQSLTVTGTYTNQGLARILGTFTVSGGNYVQSLGGSRTLVPSGGHLNAGSNLVQINTGVLEGRGTVTANTVQVGTSTGSATIRPGDGTQPVGILNIVGNYTQGNNGISQFQIAGGGGVAGTDFDRLAVSGGTATLGGKLGTTTVDPYRPVVDDSFAVLTGTVSGVFDPAKADLLIGGGRMYVPRYSGSGVAVQAELMPSLSITDVTVGEDAGVVSLTITRTADDADILAVTQSNFTCYSVEGTAKKGSDYTFTKQVKVFAANNGVDQTTCDVTIIDDLVPEGDETFKIALREFKYARANPDTAVVTISGLNND